MFQLVGNIKGQGSNHPVEEDVLFFSTINHDTSKCLFQIFPS